MSRASLIRGKTSPVAWIGGLLAALATAVVLTPIVIVVLTSLSGTQTGFIGDFTLDTLWDAVSSKEDRDLLVNTLVFTVGSTAVAMALAILLAWIVTSTDVPFPRVSRLLPLAPLLLPPLLKDTAWVQLYSPKTGVVNLGLMEVFGLSDPPFDIFSMGGMIINAGVTLVPIPYLIVSASLLSVNRSLEEASRLAGATTLRTLRRIVLPIVTPAILSGFALTALLVAAAFETPLIIGGPAGIDTYMSAIYESLASSSLPNYQLAAAQADIYLLLGVLLLTWYVFSTRREQRFHTVTGKGYSRTPSFRRWRWLFFGIVVAHFVIAFGLVFAQSILVSLVPFYTTTQGFPFKDLSLINYEQLFSEPLTSTALRNSIQLSAIVTAVTVGLAILLATVTFQSRIRGRRLLEVIGTLPIAVPPLVFSVALLLTVLVIPGLRTTYGTLLPMVVVEVIIFLPFAMRAVAASLLQISPDLREAAALSGAGIGRRLRTISVPLVQAAVVNAVLIVFVLSFRELAGVALLTAADTPIVPSVALNFYFVGEFGIVSALNVVMVVLPAVVVALFVGVLRLTGYARRRYRRTSMGLLTGTSEARRI